MSSCADSFGPTFGPYMPTATQRSPRERTVDENQAFAIDGGNKFASSPPNSEVVFGPSLPPAQGLRASVQEFNAENIGHSLQGTHGSPLGPNVPINLGSQTDHSWTIPVDGVFGPSLPNPSPKEAVGKVTPKVSQRPIHSYNPLARDDSELSECSTDSDSDYDEEEERRKARINRGVQQRKYQVEVIHQQETIRKFRQEREIKEQMEAEMAALRANIARAEAWERGDDDDELLRQKRAEEAAASLAEALDQESVYGDSTVACIWKEHAELWVKFQDDPPQQITVEDVPWPPDAAQVLAIMAAEEKQVVSSKETADCQCGELSTYAAYKIAFRRASLRWHPDKFEARFGSRLSNECTTSDGLSHRQQVITRVQGVSQAVNDAWDCIQGKMRHI